MAKGLLAVTQSSSQFVTSCCAMGRLRTQTTMPSGDGSKGRKGTGCAHCCPHALVTKNIKELRLQAAEVANHPMEVDVRHVAPTLPLNVRALFELVELLFKINLMYFHRKDEAERRPQHGGLLLSAPPRLLRVLPALLAVRIDAPDLFHGGAGALADARLALAQGSAACAFSRLSTSTPFKSPACSSKGPAGAQCCGLGKGRRGPCPVGAPRLGRSGSRS